MKVVFLFVYGGMKVMLLCRVFAMMGMELRLSKFLEAWRRSNIRLF